MGEQRVERLNLPPAATPSLPHPLGMLANRFRCARSACMPEPPPFPAGSTACTSCEHCAACCAMHLGHEAPIVPLLRMVAAQSRCIHEHLLGLLLLGQLLQRITHNPLQLVAAALFGPRLQTTCFRAALGTGHEPFGAACGPDGLCAPPQSDSPLSPPRSSCSRKSQSLLK